MNGHIYCHLEHLEKKSFFKISLFLILHNSAKEMHLKTHFFSIFSGGACSKTPLTWIVCLWQNLTGVVLAQGFICSYI